MTWSSQQAAISRKSFAFYHFMPADSASAPGLFLKIVTDCATEIVISPRHMIYVGNETYPVEASRVQPGDHVLQLSHVDEGVSRSLCKVKHIKTVFHHGAFSPLTEDGTIVVDGIVASTYANPFSRWPAFQ